MDNPAQKKPAGNIGVEGERLAVEYLRKKGYRILETNYRYGRGEIDIIAEKDRIVAFVEVKTKKFGDFGDPINWINRKKQLQIGAIAKGYLFENPIKDRDFRFDVITLLWEKGAYKITHIENAFWL